MGSDNELQRQALIEQPAQKSLTRPVALAVTGSLLLHVIALSWVLTRPEIERAALAAEPALTLTLMQNIEPASVPPIEPEPQLDDVAEQVLDPVAVIPPKPAADLKANPEVALNLRPQLTVEATGSAPTLDLRRPEGWSALATESPEEIASTAFKKSTRDAVAIRKQEQARRRALSRSQVERLGIPAEEYRRRTDVGEEVKTAKGCFVKRTEHGLNGLSERWWRTACRDSSVPDWKREVLSFGPDHRVLPYPESDAAKP